MNRFLSFVGWFLLTAINRTLRTRRVNSRLAAERGTENVIYAFWHGEQFMLLYRHRHQGIVVMSSLSKDGEIQSSVLRRFSYEVVRGSSSKRGDRALAETIRLVRKGRSAAFAVDGPRGPSHKVKPGLIYLALKTGKRIIPASSAVQRHAVMKRAWDRYEFPVPFSRAVIAYGEPLAVREGDNIDERTAALEKALEDLSAFTHRDYWADDLRRYLRGHPKPRILIVQPSRIGDIVFSLPTLAALKAEFPHAWIGWMVDERCAPVIEGNPFIDEIITFDRTKVSLPYLLRLRRYLREKSIDLSVDLHGLFKSAAMVVLAGAHYRIGSASTRGMKELSWLFSREIPPERDGLHCVERHLAVARYLGWRGDRVEYPLFVGGSEKSAMERFLAESGIDRARPLVALHPGGGWLSRRWHPARFSGLIDRLVSEEGAQAVLVGGKEGGAGEKGLNEEILSSLKSPALDLTGRLSLRELAAFLSVADVFVGNEAGPMHLAVALNRPVVAIIGPTDPGRTGPYRGRTRIVRHAVDCQPCRERNCAKRECMEGISVADVFAAVREMMRCT